MIPYSCFARYYDALMKDAEYDKRARYIQKILLNENISSGLVVDLACGTGSIALELAGMGYDLIGVDRSPEMLDQARNKFDAAAKNALFICQDMSKLDLYGTVDAVVCCLDSINHLTKGQTVAETFNAVSLFLNPGGLFIFDVNTPYKFEAVLADNVFTYDYGDLCCIWQNSYHKKSGLCRFDLTFFKQQGHLYQRFDESFYEKSYTDRTLRRYLKESGLSLMHVFEELSFEQPQEKTQRTVYVAQKT